MTAIRQKYYFGGEASWALGASSPPGSSRGPAGPVPLPRGAAAPTAPLAIITEAGDVSMTAPPCGDSANYPSQSIGDMRKIFFWKLSGTKYMYRKTLKQPMLFWL